MRSKQGKKWHQSDQPKIILAPKRKKIHAPVGFRATLQGGTEKTKNECKWKHEHDNFFHPAATNFIYASKPSAALLASPSSLSKGQESFATI